MMSPLLEKLIHALRVLPGVGPKSAQRMAFHLLARNRQGGKAIAQALEEAMIHIQHCEECRTFSETPRCAICLHPNRDRHLLCIVETPADMIAIEQTGYKGLYFLLLGHLSPLDGIGPQEIGLDILNRRLQKDSFQEIIIATNPTVEGEATAHYLLQLATQYKIPCSRIAHGVPFGDVLEYIDTRTLGFAMASRAQCLEVE